MQVEPLALPRMPLVTGRCPDRLHLKHHQTAVVRGIQGDLLWVLLVI